MIYCKHCGVANREGSNYCNSCGLSLVSSDVPEEGPLPQWLREVAVAGYLWKGDTLLPEWLSELRPFRELLGRDAVVLPHAASELSAPMSPEEVLTDLEDEDVSFGELRGDEDGPLEADLLLLEDLDDEEQDGYGSGQGTPESCTESTDQERTQSHAENRQG